MPFKNYKIVEDKVRNPTTGKKEIQVRKVPIDSRDKQGRLINFVGGFGWNLVYDDDPIPLEGFNLREIFPIIKNEDGISKVNTLPLSHNSIRSLEIIKEPGDDNVKFFVGGIGIDSENFANTLKVDSSSSKITKPDWLTKSRLLELQAQGYPDPTAFDIERAHCLDFSPMDTNRQSSIINELIRACSEKEAGCWVEMVWIGSFDWTKFCEISANNLAMKLRTVEDGIKRREWSISVAGKLPIPTSLEKREKDLIGLSSTVYITGSKVLPLYISRLHSNPVTISIRGMILDKDDSTLKSISSVFSNLRFVEDSLIIHQYDDLGNFLKWMNSRNISGLYGVNCLIENTNLWFGTTWGRSERNPHGRDFTPFLCLTSSELNYFVDVPNDLTLKIKKHREHVPGLSTQKTGFLMGEYI